MLEDTLACVVAVGSALAVSRLRVRVLVDIVVGRS
jgi:hypothetical protein